MYKVLIFVARILSYVLVFYAGRLSLSWWHNKYLDNKAVELSMYQTALNKEVNSYNRDMKVKEDELKKKWKDMVVDISIHQFEDQPSHLRGKWTSLDDSYLQSWISADE